jgi:hypothetical protein
MSEESSDVFFEALITDETMKRIIHLISEEKDEEEIIEDLLGDSGGESA